jgi:hypothetical protein
MQHQPNVDLTIITHGVSLGTCKSTRMKSHTDLLLPIERAEYLKNNSQGRLESERWMIITIDRPSQIQLLQITAHAREDNVRQIEKTTIV